jgi:hypothetical protein
MPAQNPVQETLDIILGQLAEIERQAADKKRTANDLCRVLQQPPMFADADAASSATTRADEYYGRQAPDVIRSILEKRKRSNLGAATVPEIYAAMIAGGYQFQTENQRHAQRGVHSILAADPMFHKLPGGGIGLASWYPAVKTKTAKDEAKPKKRRGKGRKTKKVPAITRAPTERSNHAPTNGVERFSRGGLLKKVTKLVEDLPEKFSTVEVVKKLEQETDAKVKRPSVKAALDRLAENGVLEVVAQGGPQKPATYRRVG